MSRLILERQPPGPVGRFLRGVLVLLALGAAGYVTTAKLVYGPTALQEDKLLHLLDWPLLMLGVGFLLGRMLSGGESGVL